MVAVLARIGGQSLHQAGLAAELLEQPGCAGLAGQVLGQVGGHRQAQAGAHHELAYSRRQPAENLVLEVVGDQGLGADLSCLGAGGRAWPGAGLASLTGQRRQPQACEPALGLAYEVITLDLADRPAQHREVGGRLLARARQVDSADVGQFAFQPEPGQSQAGCGPAGQQQPQARLARAG